jgi:small subunit ribosomal protein S27Ae
MSVPEQTAEAAAEEAPKPRAERKPKKKRVSPQVFKFYKTEGGRLERVKRECPRCGRGVFMAQHKDRLHCGRCGYTEWLGKKKGR